MLTVGLDTAAAPTPAAAKAALDAIGGSWWVVYLPSGTRNGGSGWTPQLVKAYAAAGIAAYLPVWVGNQDVPSLGLADPLTADLGHQHGLQAAADMRSFGWLTGCPAALDVESDTATRQTEAAVAYADGWCVAVRQGGYLPGVYAPLAFLTRLWQETNKPAWAYAADWVRTNVARAISPEQIAGLPDGFWRGARTWQYAGGNTYINGLAVDIDTADFPLAPAPGLPYGGPALLAPPAAYRVVVEHYLRTAPVLVAPHGPLVTVGERLIALGPRTTHWVRVEPTPQGPQDWAYLPNLQSAE